MNMRFFDINWGTQYEVRVDDGRVSIFFKDEGDDERWFPHQYNGLYSDRELLDYINKNVDNEIWAEYTHKKYEVICDESNNPQYRGYVFVHRGISGIYAGIQASHALVRLVFDQYANPDMIEWVTNHETLVALDGGNCDNMEYIAGILSGADNVFAQFEESDMKGMVTAIAYVPSEDEMSEIELHRRNKDMGTSLNPVVNLLLTTRSHKG